MVAEQTYDFERSFFDFQRATSAASKPKSAGPEISELERRRLISEGRSTESIECYRKFGHEAALLYGLIGVERGVTCDGKPATLVNVIGDVCRVLFGRAEKTRDVIADEVKPYRKEA